MEVGTATQQRGWALSTERRWALPDDRVGVGTATCGRAGAEQEEALAHMAGLGTATQAVREWALPHSAEKGAQFHIWQRRDTAPYGKVEVGTAPYGKVEVGTAPYGKVEVGRHCHTRQSRRAQFHIWQSRRGHCPIWQS